MARRRPCTFLAAALLAAVIGCGSEETGPRVLVRLLVDEEIYRPDEVTVGWYGPDDALLVSRTLTAAKTGPVVGTVLVTLSLGDAERKVVARGMRGGAFVSMAAARVAISGGPLDLVLGPVLADGDGDGLPDLVDGRDDVPRDAGVDLGGGPADARETSVDPPDARAVDTAAPPDVPVDVAPPDVAAPDTRAPGSPDTAAPDLLAPDVAAVPDADVPDVTAAPDAAPAPLADRSGLVAYYAFEEGSGKTLMDRSGNGNDATLRATSPQWIAGPVGGALRLVDTDWAKTTANASLNRLTRAHTLAAWINLDPDSKSYRVILNRQVGTTAGERYCLAIANGELQLSGDVETVRSGGSKVPTGRWVHVAGTYDGTAARLYIDAKEVATVSTNGTIAGDTTPLTIGAQLDGADQESATARLEGGLDELVVYSRALSAAEIRALHAGARSL